MYLRNGFEICGPFGDYKLDPHSVFMTKLLWVTHSRQIAQLKLQFKSWIRYKAKPLLCKFELS
jgi:hypothetical protein